MATNFDHAKKWKISDKRYVLYIDIMGFKDLVYRNSAAKVYTMMKSLVDSLDATIIVFGNDPKKGNNLLMMTYSDSVIICSENDSPKCQTNIIDAASYLIEVLFEEGIPFRGAISFGEMTIDVNSSIFFGQALIDAYLIVEELGFYGVVLHASAEYKKGIIKHPCISEVECLFKNGSAKHLTIAPISYYINPSDESEKKLTESIMKLKINSSGSNRRYIDQTLRYVNTLRTLFTD